MGVSFVVFTLVAILSQRLAHHFYCPTKSTSQGDALFPCCSPFLACCLPAVCHQICNFERESRTNFSNALEMLCKALSDGFQLL